jgi:uncharacterized protein (DUF1697 family)
MKLPPETLAGLLRPLPPKPKQPTARERAALNRLRALQTLAEHGHLRCADLATCWPDAKYAQQMAQRTVRTLLASGDILARRNAHGGLSYVLTRLGAAALEVRGINARHGLDLASVSGPTFTHNALTARWCLHKRTEGFQTFTEYALMNNPAPVNAQQLLRRYGKLPDAVLVRDEHLWLVETESAPKSTQELLRIVALAEHVGYRVHPELPHVLAGLFVVFDDSLNHGKRIAKAAAVRWGRYEAADQATLAGRITLARVSLGLPLVWRGCREERLKLPCV